VSRHAAISARTPSSVPSLSSRAVVHAAAVFAAAGCPAIAIGPGSIDQAHTADEFIALADLRQGAEFFLSFLKSLARP
jgi:acetylornithine deacetylase/succinyl-diaminopimelate desuccinylase-like protein